MDKIWVAFDGDTYGGDLDTLSFVKDWSEEKIELILDDLDIYTKDEIKCIITAFKKDKDGDSSISDLNDRMISEKDMDIVEYLEEYLYDRINPSMSYKIYKISQSEEVAKEIIDRYDYDFEEMISDIPDILSSYSLIEILSVK